MFKLFPIDDDFYTNRFLCSADDGGDGDGGGGNSNASGGESGASEGDKGDSGASGNDSGDSTDNEGSQSFNWKDGITSEDGKKFAEGSTDINHLVDRAVDMRKQLSTAVIPPAKDADEAAIASWRKKIDVPEAASDYTIAMPEGVDKTDIDIQFHENISKVFHDKNVPRETVKALNDMWNDHAVALQKVSTEAHADYAEESSKTLKKEWGADYDKNLEIANRAMEKFYGEDFEEFRHVKTEQGTNLADSPMQLKYFARLGTEFMESGGLTPFQSAADRESAAEEISDLRKKASDASARGDSKEANRLFVREQDLIKKTQGGKSIVGADGRAA